MNWFRMYTEFAFDAKVQMMSECMQRRLVMLFCFHGERVTLHETLHETKDVTFSDSEIAFQMRISEADVTVTKELFLEKNFINEHWTLINWNKRQPNSDSSTERVRRYREKKKQSVMKNETLHETEGETLPKRQSNALDKIRSDKKIDNKSNHHTAATHARVANSVPTEDDDFRKKNFDVDFYLDDDDRNMENVLAPNWDKSLLRRDFNAWIKNPGNKIPQQPVKAYLSWVQKTKKGKPPP
jgi:hypothetical protein